MIFSAVRRKRSSTTTPEHSRAERWRDQLAEHDAVPQPSILGLLTGILAGAVIVIFRLLVEIPLTENFEALSKIGHFGLPVLGAIVLGGIVGIIANQLMPNSASVVELYVIL